MSEHFSLTPEWLDDRFDRRVRREVFRREPQERPVVVLLGGQPGAGKTRAAEFAQNLHEHMLNVITGDDYRAVHPDYKRLQAHDPVAMPNITQEVSGPLVERAITYARENGFSALVEGTFRRPEVPLATAQEFHNAGYEVHVVALAVPPTLSRMSSVARFYQTLEDGENRWTPLTAHEAAVENMPDTLEALGASPVVDRLTLINRSGEVLMDSRSPGIQRGREAAGQIRVHQERALTSEERDEVCRTYRENYRISQTHPAAQRIAADPSVRSTWRHLALDQVSINGHEATGDSASSLSTDLPGDSRH